MSGAASLAQIVWGGTQIHWNSAIGSVVSDLTVEAELGSAADATGWSPNSADNH